ncbi:MAG TPA: DPP IV N-terminal domain-containing protein, partial [Mycobacteriales bacterium]|nr:DPP IV N-terminal domain-containing protein [Mycobacteriales bacterium]
MADTFPRQYARTRRFTLGVPRAFTVFPDRVLFLRALSGSDPRTDLWMLDLAAGTERQIVDPAGLLDDADLPAAERARRERVRETATGVVSYAADAHGRVVAFPLGGRLWVADIDAGSVQCLETAHDVYDPRPDSTGTTVAYVSGRSLRVTGVDGQHDRELLGADAEAVSWGRAEFVAAEEMNRMRGFWWGPDGSSLLVARVDESAVPVWWIADPAHPDHAPTAVRYPVAGAANADVTLHVVDLSGHRREITWDRNAFPYLARVSWIADHPPLIQVQSRDQRHVQVLAVELSDGSTRVLVEDRDDVWVELFTGVPAWCGQDVVRIADVDGVRRLFVGEQAVTPDDIYVREVAGASDTRVVFTASVGDPTQVQVFEWTPDGIVPLTDEDGWHSATIGGDVTVLSSAGLGHVGFSHRVRWAGGDVAVSSCTETPLVTPTVRLLRLGARRLPAGLLLPTGHVPGTPLPVLLDPYGGPHAQRVLST